MKLLHIVLAPILIVCATPFVIFGVLAAYLTARDEEEVLFLGGGRVIR